MKEYLYIDSNDDSRQTKFKVSNTPKIDLLIKEKRFEEALDVINNLLKTDSNDINWNLKGIILNNLSEFEESIKCFDNALSLNSSRAIQLNKAKCLYDFAKITFFPNADYEKALSLIDDALNTIPSDEDSSEYYFLKAEIYEAMNQLDESYKCYLIAYKEFDKLNEFESQKKYLESTNDTLINVVGIDFYNYSPNVGDIVDLVKDEDNEHDCDAVAVVVNNETRGYVANNEYTLIEEVKSASDIKNQINDNQKAEILFVYMGEYVIAKLI